MRGFGEITRLCNVARPDIGVVTRIAEAHTERVGGIDGVARAKSELIAALPTTGAAVLNADDARVLAMQAIAACRVVTYGRSAHADVCVENVVLDDLARARFTLRTPWGTTSVRLAASGEHMAINAAGALCVAALCGVDLERASEAVGEAVVSPWRTEITRSARGTIVINDAYNANPDSMRAAIDTLSSVRVGGRRVAILGIMAELADPVRDHLQVAELLAERGIELISVGTELYGAPARTDAVGVAMSLASDDAVLIKGSRVAGLEGLVALILNE
jgi:UDP-N-acetylmuramoyl-tripeptide--D-alanyl-D-alanine ligase